MHRRAVIATLLLLTLLGCNPDTTNKTAPIPSGDVCERVRPQLAGNWTTDSADSADGGDSGGPKLGAPLSDTCALVDADQQTHRIWVKVSILPVTDEQAVAYRKADELSAARLGYAAKVTDGGLGNGSWALNPAAAAPWLVFRTEGRQVRLRVDNDGAGTMDELRSIARRIAELPGGLPAAPLTTVRPECDRGTAAAEHVLGAKAVVRRDALVDQQLWCQWGSAARAVWVTAGRAGSGNAFSFNILQENAKSNESHRVTVGTEGWQQTQGFLVFKTGKGVYVAIASAPIEQMRPIPIVMLARAIEPAYS
ncbi:hypothetical protein [Kribbella sindirgiensis]|uniref:DUF3558 domain-containing protein n=1 Tax=Kribbella sindirgiensis TaxID=1124744 RepID=A0A4R0HWH0_9ACTN|nr:hypothetical protein [Kribbella sindirgiensis]TCC17088.1 hypothetical protein E0H50_39905 [Kribbella sindirgiensis]